MQAYDQPGISAVGHCHRGTCSHFFPALFCFATLTLTPFASARAAIVYDNLDKRFGGAAFGEDREDLYAQQFFLGPNNTVTAVTLAISREGSPTGEIGVEIWDDNGHGHPGSKVGILGSLTSVDLPGNDIRCDLFDCPFSTFDNAVNSLTPNSAYYVVLTSENDDFPISRVYWWAVENSSDGTNDAAGAQLNETGRWQTISELAGLGSIHLGMSVTVDNQGVLGDFNGDGIVTVQDIGLLALAIRDRSNDLKFDINHDGQVNSDDRSHWVHDSNFAHTYFGDANLDGEFSTADLIVVFQAGEYEDSIAANSTWSEGDWNGDSEFETGDLILAFQDGGFETGPRTATASVPEPSGIVLLAMALVGISSRRRSASN